MPPDSARITPVFILSLPRSGSTLLQRLAATHPDIATTAEPNILLYPLQALVPTDVVGLHPHDELHSAVTEFANRLPGGTRSYLSAVATFADTLYFEASGHGSSFFLDKSPSYCLVAPELLEAFAHGRFVFLFRHPLAVAASLLRFDGRDPAHWNLHRFAHLHRGLARLVEAHDLARMRSLTVNYERLVEAPAEALAHVFDYLGLEAEKDLVSRLGNVQLKGRFVDPNSRLPEYQVVRTDRASDWQEIMSNPIRKRWCRRYVEWIGGPRLASMGYNLSELQAEVAAVRTTARYLLRDLFWVPHGALGTLTNARTLQSNIRSWRAGRPFYAYR
jgi:hypothetical protein